MKNPALKAGLIGAVAILVINLIGLVPVLGCLSLPLELIAYVAVGALAVSWLPPRRMTGRSAGQGALAGLIASVAGGLARVVLTPLSLSLSGGAEAIISQLPEESLKMFEQAGLDPATLINGGTFAGFALVCCLPVALLAGAALGALGGLIFAAAKPE